MGSEADSQENGEIIYRFLILAFANGRKVLNAMSIPEVMGLHQLSRSVSRETQHLYGFLRFQELQNDILYARLVSKHHVGMFLAEHFQDRLPMEHWVIHDVERDEVWIHRAGEDWLYIRHPDFRQDPQMTILFYGLLMMICSLYSAGFWGSSGSVASLSYYRDAACCNTSLHKPGLQSLCSLAGDASVDSNAYGDRAYAAFFKGYNCCQSVAVAFAEEMGMTEKQALQISAGFGGGFGRMREVCGAFSGITLVLGALYGSDDPTKKTALYTDVQALAAEYKTRNGGPNTLICRELLGLKQAEGKEAARAFTSEATSP